MEPLLVLLIICYHFNQIANWENRFLSLGETIASIFDLRNCWVCGSPAGFEDWPWIAQPVSPKWWISTRSDVNDTTGFWTDDSDPWRLHFPGKGLYCLNRTREHGVQVGKSVCEWTLSLGFDCSTPNCPPYDCFKYRGRWNQTHVKLTNGSWVRCSYHNYKQDFEGCKAEGRDGFFDHLFLRCPRDNSTSKTHVVRDYQWKWQHQNGTRTYFSEFWSKSNKTSWGCDCRWKPHVGAWRCTYCDSYGASTVVGGPLGPGITLYFDPPIDDETWEGPFANGAWALKGHYWICGQHAYRRLPPNWSGICYVGYIRPLFFLLSQDQGKGLGVKVYDNVVREKRSIDTSLTKGSAQKWG
ncbi:syncytin-2-like [Strix aluco]|uniref:syncytin-2-like n=1 Tax=Strix aluco TaxID=111821 RepID=UPI003DA45F6C